jgi:gamma-glutamyltranspeptidase/glutathione hydrolase
MLRTLSVLLEHGLLTALAALAADLGGLLMLSLIPQPAQARAKTAQGSLGMVVAVSAPAADVGRDILCRGGNAVDAAIATEFALAVTYPAAGNIGGGGFMVVFPGPKKRTVPWYGGFKIKITIRAAL